MHPLDRRTFLAVGAAAGAGVVLAGCRLNNPYDDDPVGPDEAVERLDPDIALAVEAVAAIGVAQRLVAATGRRHPRLVAELQGLTSMHQAHHAALVEAVPQYVDLGAPATPPQVAGRPVVARKRVVQAEVALRGQLGGFALRAESGPFARLLGSMAASVGQHETVLG